jgi:hypothetical protein
MERVADFDYLILIVRWTYLPSHEAISRNVPSEARRILVGPLAAGAKKYPWAIEGLTDLLEIYDFALIKPREHKIGQGRVGPAEGAIAIYKFKKRTSDDILKDIIIKISNFCEEWKNEGKYGNKIISYEINLAKAIVYR